MAKKQSARRPDGLIPKTFTVDGKRHWIYGKDAEELREKENQKRAEIKAGMDRRTNPTFEEYSQDWLNRVRKTVKSSTAHAYSKNLNTICGVEIRAGAFGKLRLKEILPADCHELQDILEENHVSSTVNTLMALCKRILDEARKERTIEFNACETIHGLKRKKEEARAKDTTHRALTSDEVAAILDELRKENSFYTSIIEFQIATGMRLGEIGALRISDIKRDVIEVRRTLTDSEGGYEIGDDAKTARSIRDIPLTADLRRIINEQKDMLRILGMIGDIVAIDQLLFPGYQGGILNHASINTALEDACEVVGIDRITSHGLRATWISQALAAGIDPRIVAEIAGHDVSMTLSIYSHVFDKDKKTAMNLLEERRAKEA